MDEAVIFFALRAKNYLITCLLFEKREEFSSCIKSLYSLYFFLLNLQFLIRDLEIFFHMHDWKVKEAESGSEIGYSQFFVD